MDNAVALVQAYLRINGYFTVTEYPVFEATKGGGYSAATDLDVLAFRFPGAGRRLAGGADGPGGFAPDPILGAPGDRPDMIVGEVKEGKAELNRAARDPRVLAAVLARFGCCPGDFAERVAAQLVRTGRAKTGGHEARLVAFGVRVDAAASPRYHRVSLGHVTDYLERYIREHWDLLHHGQFKDPAFGFLVTLEKARRGRPDDGSFQNDTARMEGLV